MIQGEPRSSSGWSFWVRPKQRAWPWTYRRTKRGADIALSVIAIVLLMPLFIVIALAVWLDSGLPIIYGCQRLGLGGQPIRVLKFRTMTNGSHHQLAALLTANEEQRIEYAARRKLRRDPRRTRVGRLLRRASVDELPQLLNVLAGDMSLVGPRPYLVEELQHRPEASELLSVRPGMSGLWQVNGRSERTFEERIALDLHYVRYQGFILDAAIAGRTMGAVLSGRGAY